MAMSHLKVAICDILLTFLNSDLCSSLILRTRNTLFKLPHAVDHGLLLVQIGNTMET